MSFTSDESKLTSVAALRALGHPTRLRILGHLQLSGDATATECAAEVGESASSCSYHLRLLAQHGFVEQVPTDDGRERRWHSTVHSVDFDAGAERDEEFQAASSLARAALLELSDTNVRDYLSAEHHFSPAWREAAAFLQTAVVASPASSSRSRSASRPCSRSTRRAPANGNRAAPASSTSACARCRSRDPAAPSRELNFRRFFIGQSVSLLGDQMTLIALPLTAVLALARDRRADGRADDR